MPDRLDALFADILSLDPAEVTDQTSPETTATWDSLANMILLSAIEETFDVQLDTEEIVRMKNVGAVRDILRARGAKLAD